MVVAGKQIDNKKLIIGVVIAAAAGVAIWLTVRAVRRRAADTVFGSNTQHFDAIGRLTEVNNMTTEISNQSTITKEKASQLAQQIKDAWSVVNDDEQAIYNALQQINNYSDWLLLQSAYGINSTMLSSRDLVGDLASRLTDDELHNVNSILNSKGIMDRIG